MISKEDFNKALGDKSCYLSEEEANKMRIAMDALADTIFDIWNNKTIKLDE